MQLNHGKFQDNGGCGYVLKPDYLLIEGFNPNAAKDYLKLGNEKLIYTITVIAARHLESSNKKGMTNPYVDIELFGAQCDRDSQDRVRHRTKLSSKMFTFKISKLN